MTEPTPEELKATFLPRLEEELRGLREASVQTAADRRPVELDQQSVGRLSRMDALQGQAMAAGLDARRHARIRAIEAAFRRLEEDEFGYCVICGDLIEIKRLELDPTVTSCVACRS